MVEQWQRSACLFQGDYHDNVWGRPVHCFGMPFYAGWGLTHDRLEAPSRRRCGASLEALVHAVLVASSRCIDPHRHQPCRIEVLMHSIGLQRRLQRLSPKRCVAFGFTPWKQRNLRRFLAGSQVGFRTPWWWIPKGVDAVVVWGRRGRPRRRGPRADFGGPRPASPASRARRAGSPRRGPRTRRRRRRPGT